MPIRQPHRSPSPPRRDFSSRPRQRPHGFTLTEMLVATALTLIILLIFAQVYRAATATIVQQRGIGQNDARARMLSTVVRNDLQKASFRDHPQSTARGLLNLGTYDAAELGFSPIHRNQAGYFYISENDLDNDVDDVLQFTISVDQTSRTKEDHPYVGKAGRIGRPSTSSTVAPGQFNGDDPSEYDNPDTNQPEYDDGNNSNGAGQSRYAEVVYFVRNGTLYRRLMLLRDPLTYFPPGHDAQPTYYEPSPPPGDLPLIPGDYDANADFDASPGGGDFWNDFDYSAFHDSVQMQFLGAASLANASRGSPVLLSDPRHRFGFQFRTNSDPNRLTAGCNPVEYVSNGNAFIGRFTHEETSHNQFSWPARFPNNPFMQNDLSLDRGVVRDASLGVTYRDGLRRGEDVLLPNVDGFDVKVWEIDPGGATGNWVDIGHTGTGYFSANARRNLGYGSRSSGRNNIFDTWHPNNYVYGDPPFRPLVEQPPDPVATPPDPDRGNWVAGQTINLTATPPTRIFPFTIVNFGPDQMPGQINVDDDGDGTIDERDEAGVGVGDDFLDYYDGIYYEAVDIAGGGVSGTTSVAADAPSFRKRYGERITDNEVVWQAFDNRVGVPLVQITIRYRDPASNLSRQLTIQHSLTDRNE